MVRTREELTPGVGIPTGPAASALFAGLLLHEIDNEIIGGQQPGIFGMLMIFAYLTTKEYLLRKL